MTKCEKRLTRNGAAEFLETYLHKQQTIFPKWEKWFDGAKIQLFPFWKQLKRTRK